MFVRGGDDGPSILAGLIHVPAGFVVLGAHLHIVLVLMPAADAPGRGIGGELLTDVGGVAVPPDCAHAGEDKNSPW